MVRKRNTEDKSARLIGAVGEILCEKGYRGPGLNKVALAAGFSKPMVPRNQSLNDLLRKLRTKERFRYKVNVKIFKLEFSLLYNEKRHLIKCLMLNFVQPSPKLEVAERLILHQDPRRRTDRLTAHSPIDRRIDHNQIDHPIARSSIDRQTVRCSIDLQMPDHCYHHLVLGNYLLVR